MSAFTDDDLSPRTAEVLATYGDDVPEELRALWRIYGVEAACGPLGWARLVDPREYASRLPAWFSDVDRDIVVATTVFGDLFVWRDGQLQFASPRFAVVVVLPGNLSEQFAALTAPGNSVLFSQRAAQSLPTPPVTHMYAPRLLPLLGGDPNDLDPTPLPVRTYWDFIASVAGKASWAKAQPFQEELPGVEGVVDPDDDVATAAIPIAETPATQPADADAPTALLEVVNPVENVVPDDSAPEDEDDWDAEESPETAPNPTLIPFARAGEPSAPAQTPPIFRPPPTGSTPRPPQPTYTGPEVASPVGGIALTKDQLASLADVALPAPTTPPIAVAPAAWSPTLSSARAEVSADEEEERPEPDEKRRQPGPVTAALEEVLGRSDAEPAPADQPTGITQEEHQMNESESVAPVTQAIAAAVRDATPTGPTPTESATRAGRIRGGLRSLRERLERVNMQEILDQASRNPGIASLIAPPEPDAEPLDLLRDLVSMTGADDSIRLPGDTRPALEGALTLAPADGVWTLSTFDYGQSRVVRRGADEEEIMAAAVEYTMMGEDPQPMEDDERARLLAAQAPQIERLEAEAVRQNAFRIAIPEGILLDRYGAQDGFLLYPAGTPFERRSLPEDARDQPVWTFLTQQPVAVIAESTAPWFDQPGGAVRFRLLDERIGLRDLAASGALRPIAT